MRSLVVFAALALGTPAAISGVPECMIGRWKSDEALTLADMRKHPEVTEKAKALFENKFFGRLILIFGSRYAGSYFEGEQDQRDRLLEKIEVVASGSNWVTLSNRYLDTENIQQWVCEDGRIYAEVTKWKFREYFSPMP